ncbi:MAG: carboxypeptidase-like regulatory domain-containing protein, partial [Bacteroidales bacterium]|nr:carboxypeptidase-like regulatory domain-containing protein [Bacteroidales bacterium]
MDEENQPVFLANVAVKGMNLGTMTDENGAFNLRVPSGTSLEVIVSCVGFKTRVFNLRLETSEIRELNLNLEKDITELDEVSVSVRQERATSFRSIDISALNMMPNTSGSLEGIIKTLPGVSSNNELSSQYSVRGGNFDENLIYVNDIEIYRPFLVRSGQQEGLSFINPDLVSSIRFSAGGFDARYGDKMSSALDIKYRTPEEFAGSASLSLLGGSVHLEGVSKNNKLSVIGGLRYKNTAYLLNSLQTKGEYQPSFGDFQTLLRYQISPKLEFSFLGNVSLNQYNFIPKTSETEFGTASTPLNLVIYYEGNEIDRFDTYFGAGTLEYKPKSNLRLKLISSGFNTSEKETYDILGQYLINELDNTIGSETYGDSILNIGIGAFLNHARNYLDAYVGSISHIGEFDASNHKFRWGLSYEYHQVSDKLSEWQLVDSAGYSVPTGAAQLLLNDVIKAENEIENYRVSGFFQDTWGFKGLFNEYFVTAGIRTSYLGLNQQLLVSPRASFSMKPSWDRDFMFHFSTGIYYQPPFYKEMRNPEGVVNKDLKAQKSIHIVAGGDYIFQAWNRPFKFSTELYYKHLSNMVPYKVDNVRIRYAGENLAKGFATGIDFKLNGEFVKGAESWASLSFMRTREDIWNDVVILPGEDGKNTVYEPGYYPRPTDQLMTFGLYFQDYL